MTILMNTVRKIAHLMHMLAGAILFAMMITVLVDIITRGIFGLSGGSIDLTIRGGIEIIRYGLLTMVLFSLPYSVSRGQVIVDLFTEHWSERVKKVLAGFYTIGFSLLGFAMAIRFFEAIDRTAKTGETTQDLFIPISYIFTMATFGAFMLGLRGALVAYKQISDGIKAS